MADSTAEELSKQFEVAQRINDASPLNNSEFYVFTEKIVKDIAQKVTDENNKNFGKQLAHEKKKHSDAMKIMWTFVGLLATGLITMGAFIVTIYFGRLDKLDDQYASLSAAINGDASNNVIGLSEKVNTLKSQMDSLLEDLDRKPVACNGELTLSSNGVITVGASPIIGDDNILGYESGGNVVYADDVVNDLMLLTYEENGLEVYFYGYMNENYHWNGECITNVYYADGTLKGIVDAHYDDGTMLDFESFCQIKDRWIYSNKTVDGDSFIGINREYIYDNSVPKSFAPSNVRVTDILFTSDFIENTQMPLVREYNGSTENGGYEDTTGNAYVVSFDPEDGKVISYYKGNFVNSKRCDSTGEAFAIEYMGDDKYENADNKYHLNSNTIFSDNHAKDTNNPGLEKEEFDEILVKYGLDKSYEWKY